MASRDPDPAPLRATGVEIGLHLELRGRDATRDAAPAGASGREAAVRALHDQLGRLADALGAPPAYLDGHHHCHAAPGLAAPLAREAARWALPVRSVSTQHRRTLRRLGVATADRLVGRLAETEPVVPAELRPLIDGVGGLEQGVTEWMLHPGHRDPDRASGYDAGREEDLGLLLSLVGNTRLRAVRATHAAAFGM
jgi:predicted glycoside hydrolase/deacetylase ChbG (UPF0249 family)